MEDPLLSKCDSRESKSDSELVTNPKGTETPDKGKLKAQMANPNPSHLVHPMSSGALNCMLAVDNVIRATADLGTPRKFSLARDNVWSSEDSDPLLLPLQNTRHLFVKDYNKALKFPVPVNSGSKIYQILNSNGDCIYYAVKRASFLNKLIFVRGLLPFLIEIVSLDGESVMEFQGHPCFKNLITVKDSRGDVLGRIKRFSSCCVQKYKISFGSESTAEILNISGPEGSSCCLFSNCGESQDFDINMGPSPGCTIGKISKEWEYALEDYAGLFVPMRLDEVSMALLLGAVFFIDLNYYQRRNDVSCFSRCFLTFFSFAMFILLLFLIAKK